MIVYQLQCRNGHEFEAWFRDSTTYEMQVKDRDIVCPFCGDTDVGKAIMAPNISTSKTAPKDADMNREENAPGKWPSKSSWLSAKSATTWKRIVMTLAIILLKRPGASITARLRGAASMAAPPTKKPKTSTKKASSSTAYP